MFKPPQIKRYTLDMAQKNVDVNTLGLDVLSMYPYASTLDFPTINENYGFKNYCYVYGEVYAVNSTDFLDMVLVKKDICTGGKEDKAWYRSGSFF